MLIKEVFKTEEKITVGKHEISKEIDFKKKVTNSIIVKEKWFRKIVYLPTDVNFKKHKVETVKKVEGSTEIGVVLNSSEMSLNLKEYLVNIHYKDLEDMSIVKPLIINFIENVKIKSKHGGKMIVLN